MAGERKTWEIRVGVYTTEDRAQELAGQIRLLLCPEPEHSSPCPDPWATALLPADESYPELREQYDAQNSPSAESEPSAESGSSPDNSG